MNDRANLCHLLAKASLLVILFLAQGCSMLVGNSGLKPEKVFHTAATGETVQKHLGKPVYREENPAKLEFPLDGAPSPYQPLRVPNGSIENPAVREDYRYKGYVVPVGDDGSRAAASLLLFEPILFPGAVIDRTRNARNEHWFSVWYDSSGRYITARKGNPPVHSSR